MVSISVRPSALLEKSHMTKIGGSGPESSGSRLCFRLFPSILPCWYFFRALQDVASEARILKSQKVLIY
jgi:hypothetical protein